MKKTMKKIEKVEKKKIIENLLKTPLSFECQAKNRCPLPRKILQSSKWLPYLDVSFRSKTPSKESPSKAKKRSQSTKPWVYRDDIRKIFSDGFFEFKLIGFANASLNGKEQCRKVGCKTSRSPEVLMGLHFNYKTDLWAAGCLIYKIAAGKNLFYTKPYLLVSEKEQILAQIVEFIGKPPETMVSRSSKAKVRLVLI